MVEVLTGEKHKGETSKAIQACNDYLRMGPGRSLRTLARSYHDSNQKLAPTQSLGTLTNWSTRHDWQLRAEQYDSELEARKNAEAESVMQDGLALPHERVRMLKEMADSLQQNVIWTGVKRGKSVEVIDPAIVAQLRGTLDDLAKETGGRIAKAQVDTQGKLTVEYVNDWRPNVND